MPDVVGHGIAPSADEEDFDEDEVENADDDDDEEEEDEEENGSVSSSIAGDFYVCNLTDHRQLEPFPDSPSLHCPQFNGVDHPGTNDDAASEFTGDPRSISHAEDSLELPTVIANETPLRKMASLDDLEMVVMKSSSSSPQSSRPLFGSDAHKSTDQNLFTATRFPFQDDQVDLPSSAPDVARERGTNVREEESLVGSTEVHFEQGRIHGVRCSEIRG